MPIPNKYGVYSKDDAELLTASSGKVTANLRLLEIHNGWVSSLEVGANDWCHSGPLTANHGLYLSREEAFERQFNWLISAWKAKPNLRQIAIQLRNQFYHT